MGSGPNIDLGEFEALMSNAGIGIVVHDQDGRVVQANDAYARLLGYTVDEALGLRADDVFQRGDHEDKSPVTEQKLVRRDGSTIWVRARKSVLDRGAQSYVLVIVEDWTEHRERLSELEHTAEYDWLTGVRNRSGLHADIARRIDGSEAVSAVMIDLNEFKSVNDAYGHRVGDELLKQVARRLVDLVGPDDTVARLSGDEFVIVTIPGRAELISGQVHGALIKAIDVGLDGIPLLHMTTATGHAGLVDSMSPTDLLDAADRSMYDNKRGNTPRP